MLECKLLASQTKHVKSRWYYIRYMYRVENWVEIHVSINKNAKNVNMSQLTNDESIGTPKVEITHL